MHQRVISGINDEELQRLLCRKLTNSQSSLALRLELAHSTIFQTSQGSNYSGTHHILEMLLIMNEWTILIGIYLNSFVSK